MRETKAVKPKRGRPPGLTGKAKAALIQVRISEKEQAAFQRAAELDGKKLSEWVRDRLRRVSRSEIESHGEEVSFL